MHELNEDCGNTREGVSFLMFVVWETNQRDSIVFQLEKHLVWWSGNLIHHTYLPTSIFRLIRRKCVLGCRVSICMFSRPCLRVHKGSNIRRGEDYGVTSPVAFTLWIQICALQCCVLRLYKKDFGYAHFVIVAFCVRNRK